MTRHFCHRRRGVGGLLVLGCWGLTACSSSPNVSVLQPSDFTAGGPEATIVSPAPVPSAEVAATAIPGADTGVSHSTPAAPVPDAVDPREASAAGSRTENLSSAPVPPPPISAASPPPAAPAGPRTERPLVMDGMIGQVNGQAIYASRLLDAHDEELTRLGQSLPPAAFRQEAGRLLMQDLNTLVFNNLTLGEAERELSDQERQGLDFWMRSVRDDLIRQWGGGSLVLADQALRAGEHLSLDDKVRQEREKILIGNYMRKKFLPRINVTRKDIERYYNDHPEKFRPEPARTVRLIRADSATAADQVEQALAGGESFTTVAGGPLNAYHREQGGLFAEHITGKQIFGVPALNDAALSLAAGAHSPRLAVGEAFYWVYVEAIEGGQAKTLRDAELEIEELLRTQRFRQLQMNYQSQLLAQGTYNPLADMAQTLLEIAMNRYSRPST